MMMRFRFVLDQPAFFDFYSASSLKQQSADRHVAPLGHIILLPRQPVFALSPLNAAALWRSNKYQFYSLYTLTITPPMRFFLEGYRHKSTVIFERGNIDLLYKSSIKCKKKASYQRHVHEC